MKSSGLAPEQVHARVVPADAEQAISRFLDLCSGCRGAAILCADGGLIAASDAQAAWQAAARELLDAADAAAGTRAVHAHIATDDGEVFAIRSSGFAMVAVTQRFVLASLVLSDMRAALRGLAPRAQVVEVPRPDDNGQSGRRAA